MDIAAGLRTVALLDSTTCQTVPAIYALPRYTDTIDMSLQKIFSRPLKKLERRFARGRREPDRKGVDIAEESVDPPDLPPQPEPGVVATDGYSQGRNEVSDDEGEAGLIEPSSQPGALETAATDGCHGELGRSGVGVDQGEVGLMDPSLRLGGEEASGSGRSQGGAEAVVDGIGPVDLPKRSDPGISGHPGPPSGT